MTTTRRGFLQASAGSVALLGLGWPPGRAAAADDSKAAGKSLRILILGGTGFIGPHIVRRAVEHGHQVTLFNRGQTNTHLFPEIEKLKGDRNDDLAALEGREWDVVIDNSASIPRWVRQSAQLLAPVAERYLFTSSISVYADVSTPGATEEAALATIEDETIEIVDGETYGALKALCEAEAAEAFGDGTIIVRPGLIVGPGDRSDRFTYWPARIDRGGEVLAPGSPDDPVQIIDARDLADWYVQLLEADVRGVFHATGPESPLSMAGMLYGIRAVTSAPVSFTWVDADFLAEQEVMPWADMPVWVPPRDGYEGFSTVDCSKAIGQGLTFRPLADTSRDTLEWWKTLPEDRRQALKAGLFPEREREVLAAWHAREAESAAAGETD